MGYGMVNGVSSDAVLKATGRSWDGWFALLELENAQALPHPEIARLVELKYAQSGWWSQMITVGFEQARGLRAKHQQPDGFAVSVSKTIAAPVQALFAAWQDEATRHRWLPDAPLLLRKATPNRSLRIGWEDGSTLVSVEIYPKGEGRGQVSVNHSKLPDADTADEFKRYWSSALVRLKLLLEER